MGEFDELAYLDRVFTYHAPKGTQQKRYEELRAAGRNLAYMVLHDCPDSNERDRALEGIEQAIMWANASIARNE
jgi:hypothetical protein